MSFKYILDSVSEKLGYDPTDDRDLLTRIINRATREVYESQDLPGSLREITLVVPPDSIIALPRYVGELRAMRERATKAKIELKEMDPRYSYNSWPEIWRNWRILKKSPIQHSIENAAFPIILSMGKVENVAVNITITGATLTSARVTEPLTFLPGTTTVQANNLYIDIHSITKESPNTQNITLTGLTAQGVSMVLAVIPNDQLDSIYTLADVSMLPMSGDASGGSARYIEVLYKEPLYYLSNDGDTFICEGFDDAIVYKALEHEYAEKADGGDKAIGFYKKCEQVIFNRVNHSNGASQKEIMFAPNQYFNLFPRFIPYRGNLWFGVNR